MSSPFDDGRRALRLLGLHPRRTAALILATGLVLGTGILVLLRPAAAPAPFGQLAGDAGRAERRTRIAAGALFTLAVSVPASFLLAWAVARERELALQVAFGATRGHLFRQFLVTSALVVGPATGLGLVCAVLARPWVAAPAEAVPALCAATVLGGAAAWAACSSLVTGLLPALHAFRIAPAAALRADGPGADLAPTTAGWQHGLAVLQAAALAILLGAAGAGLVQEPGGTDSALAQADRAERLLFGLTFLVALGLVGFCGYGLTGQGVNHRRTELALRVALGATRWQLLPPLLWAHARPFCSGAAFGLAIIWLGEQTLSAQSGGCDLAGLWSCLVAGAAAIVIHQAAGFLTVHRVALRAETERPGRHS